MKSRKKALEDAISATIAAMAEGVVPGGGCSLLQAEAANAAVDRGNHDVDTRTSLRHPVEIRF